MLLLIMKRKLRRQNKVRVLIELMNCQTGRYSLPAWNDSLARRYYFNPYLVVQMITAFNNQSTSPL